MKRKCLAIGIILLFIGTTIIPTTAQKIEKSSSSSSRGNWLYVGGSGPGNYTTIQDAMSNATDGDTIFVYSGIYSTLTIRKSLTIIGENESTTIIDGNGSDGVVAIEANDVNLYGFTIQNGGWGLSIQQRTNVTVSDIILNNNNLAIFHWWDRNTLLENVTFINNDGGISLWDVQNCTITHCVFNHAGISHNGFSPSAHGSLYIQNNLFTNDSCISTDYLVIESHGITTIESNIFKNNACPLLFMNGDGITILKNNFINNTQNVQLEKSTFLWEVPFHLTYHQHWKNNYWSDWDQTGFYKIRGTWYVGNVYLYIKLHFREYDLNPAKEPYDIPGIN
jgi:parallel beta-helix repeat protein